MPTTATFRIAESGTTPTPDYTSLTAFVAGEAGDITAAGTDEVHVAECGEYTAGLNDTCDLTGYTLDSTHYVHIRPASGFEHGGVHQAGFYVYSNANPAVFNAAIDNSYIIIEGIDAEHTKSTGLQPTTPFYLGHQTLCINCLGKTAHASRRSFVINYGGTASAYCVNCISHNSSGGNTGFYNGGTSKNLDCWGCLSIGAKDGFELGGAAGGDGHTVKNCAACDNSGTDYLDNHTSVNFDGDYNAGSSSVAADVPGSNDVLSLTTAAFKNYAGGDWSHAAAGALVGEGNDYSGDFSSLWFPTAIKDKCSEDITGVARSGTWDIGPFSAVTGAPVLLPRSASIAHLLRR